MDGPCLELRLSSWKCLPKMSEKVIKTTAITAVITATETLAPLNNKNIDIASRSIKAMNIWGPPLNIAYTVNIVLEKEPEAVVYLFPCQKYIVLVPVGVLPNTLRTRPSLLDPGIGRNLIERLFWPRICHDHIMLDAFPYLSKATEQEV